MVVRFFSYVWKMVANTGILLLIGLGLLLVAGNTLAAAAGASSAANWVCDPVTYPIANLIVQFFLVVSAAVASVTLMVAVFNDRPRWRK